MNHAACSNVGRWLGLVVLGGLFVSISYAGESKVIPLRTGELSCIPIVDTGSGGRLSDTPKGLRVYLKGAVAVVGAKKSGEYVLRNGGNTFTLVVSDNGPLPASDACSELGAPTVVQVGQTVTFSAALLDGAIFPKPSPVAATTDGVQGKSPGETAVIFCEEASKKCSRKRFTVVAK